MKCCDITAGKLRNTIRLQRAVTASDGAGGQQVTWSTYATVSAYILPLTGNERLQADRLENPLRKRITIRYRAGVEERDRVLYNGQAHHIQYIADIEERRQWLEIGVTKGVAT